jgi:hypothetical protein
MKTVINWLQWVATKWLRCPPCPCGKPSPRITHPRQAAICLDCLAECFDIESRYQHHCGQCHETFWSQQVDDCLCYVCEHHFELAHEGLLGDEDACGIPDCHRCKGELPTHCAECELSVA